MTPTTWSTSTGPRSGILTLIDTHIALWLYAGEPDRLPERARDQLDTGPIRLPALAVLELAYLHEVGRARDSVATMLAALSGSIGLDVADVGVETLTEAATSLTWTRDPFDRLIAAQAIVEGVPLVTADRTILENLTQAVWD